MSGFTFVETLVAIAVLLIALVAPLSLTYQSLAASRIARNQITATYLAEGAIEYVRAERDSNALSGNSWLFGLSDCLTSPGCMIDVPDHTVTACSASGCDPLRYDDETHFYGYVTGTTSPFTQSVLVTESVADAEAQIAVTVTWQDGATTRTVGIDESIFNWQ